MLRFEMSVTLPPAAQALKAAGLSVYGESDLPCLLSPSGTE